jgi:SH3-like domain-containing protein
MKVLLLLGLVGAAIYGALVLSGNLLPRDPADGAFARQSLGDPSDRELRSWGTDLPALASSSAQEAPPPLPKAAVTPASTSPAPSSEAKPTTLGSEGSDGTAYRAMEWAKVVFAAKVHGDASVSSPTLRFYQPGTALQVVSRQNGWVQITDPTSGEPGWVFEQYLVPADSPTTIQTAMATTARKAAVESAPTAKKRVRAARQAARTDKFAVTQFDRRWERRAARRGGLFFFGRFARAE